MDVQAGEGEPAKNSELNQAEKRKNKETSNVWERGGFPGSVNIKHRSSRIRNEK